MSTLIMDDPRCISALIEWQRTAGYGFRLAMYRAALAREIRLLDLTPGARVPRQYLQPGAPPTLVVLGDDGDEPTGPAGFPQTQRLLAWADALILHSCGGEEGHYQAAVVAARTARRALMIETGTARRNAWTATIQAELARRRGSGRKPLPVLDIQVRPGAPAHPLRAAA